MQHVDRSLPASLGPQAAPCAMCANATKQTLYPENTVHPMVRTKLLFWSSALISIATAPTQKPKALSTYSRNSWRFPDPYVSIYSAVHGPLTGADTGDHYIPTARGLPGEKVLGKWGEARPICSGPAIPAEDRVQYKVVYSRVKQEDENKGPSDRHGEWPVPR